LEYFRNPVLFIFNFKMYIRRLFIVFIISIVAAFAAGMIFDNIYKKRWQTLFFEKTDELLKGKTNYDIIYLGNSRVHFAINPYYVDSVTKLNSYNFGFGGADAEEIMLTSNIYLNQHKAPKFVIISLDNGALLKNNILQTRFHYLYFLHNDTIKKHMNQAGFFTSLIKVFPFTKYSFFDEYNRTSLFVKGKSYPLFEHNIYKGFLNIHQHTHTKAIGIYNAEEESGEISDNAIAYFRNCITALQQKGSMVIFVSPPVRSSPAKKQNAFDKKADSIFSSLAIEFHLKHLHFEDDKIYENEYFVDDIHFNEPGSRLYSQNLGDSINLILDSILKSP